MKLQNCKISSQRQQGAVLFVALVFLVLLTLLGVVASSTSIMQERMTGGLRNHQLALMGSESALRGGEWVVWSTAVRASLASGGDAMPPCVSGATGFCTYDRPNGVENPLVTAFRSTRTWISPSSDGAIAYPSTLSGLSGATATASLAAQPRFMIEDLGLDTSASSGISGRMSAARLQEIGGVGGAPPRRWYRITARSQGGSSASSLGVTESVYSAYGTNHQFRP